MIAREEGILAALETSHAIALALQLAPQFAQNSVFLVNVSGRGDKDLHTVMQQGGQ